MKIRQPGKPEEPTPYQKFIREMLKKVKEANPDMSNTDVMKTACRLW